MLDFPEFRHGSYEQPVPRTPAPKFVGHIRKPRTSTAVLNRKHVNKIRRWAQGPGSGLSLRQQIAWLKAKRYPGIGRSTLENVLTNASWYDPGYDRPRREVA